MPSSSDVKAVIEHGFADLEAALASVGKPELAAEVEKVKALVENPLFLEIAALAITEGLKKLGLGLAANEPKAA